MTQQSALIRIVDDDPTVCEAQSFFLRLAGFDVVSYNNPLDFFRFDDHRRPGCVILDVRMPQMSGIEVQVRMQKEGINLPVIFLSAHGDIEMAIGCVKRGAFNFLVKPPEPEKLSELVAQAVKKNRDDQRQADYVRSLEAQFFELTQAESQIAVMVAKGLSNKTIAEALEVSERTVQTHRSSVYLKLDCTNAVEVAEFLHDLKGE